MNCVKVYVYVCGFVIGVFVVVVGVMCDGCVGMMMVVV